MASRKLYSAKEALEKIFQDEDSDVGEFDLGDDGEAIFHESDDSDWEYDHVSTEPEPSCSRKRRLLSTSPEKDVSLNTSPALSDHQSSDEDVLAPVLAGNQDNNRGRAAVRGRPRRARGTGGNSRRAATRWDWNEVQQFDQADIPFTGAERLRVRMANGATAIDYFELYITDVMIEHIVTETNSFAEQFLADHELGQRATGANWTPVTVLEAGK